MIRICFTCNLYYDLSVLPSDTKIFFYKLIKLVVVLHGGVFTLMKTKNCFLELWGDACYVIVIVKVYFYDTSWIFSAFLMFCSVVLKLNME